VLGVEISEKVKLTEQTENTAYLTVTEIQQ
jgi:hypothetical protein